MISEKQVLRCISWQIFAVSCVSFAYFIFDDGLSNCRAQKRNFWLDLWTIKSLNYSNESPRVKCKSHLIEHRKERPRWMLMTPHRASSASRRFFLSQIVARIRKKWNFRSKNLQLHEWSNFESHLKHFLSNWQIIEGNLRNRSEFFSTL